MAPTVIFLVFAFIAVVTGIGVIFSRNAVYSALLLVVNFFCLAAFYVMLNAQFLAAVQVTVYAGAIMVLFVFVIMLLSPAREQSVFRSMRRQGLTAIPLALIFIGLLVLAVSTGSMTPMRDGYSLEEINRLGGGAHAVGSVLFTEYLLPFEVTSLLLIIALVGAIVLGKRRT